ncbi:endonuclease/exonuclease/phosphatase family protein [Nocardioides pocheonensis]|uniref:Endonuclease n=1 Tax=Nocardioides pocheonensis TaxID=661485 RepID=A0A3N0GTY1_9ACTN|nr:endonuclease/exonuclease/phosphatase family protein [Nocardioides pocheonensis]RNM15925.1 endonuclease [Nocardioides pocheonensis]
MRVATFNILHGRCPDDDEVHVDRFARAVAALDADVLALQEVDRNQARSRNADLTSIAADAMGAPHHRFVAALSGSPGSTWLAATGDEQPDDAAYGVALLSRHPLSAWQVVRLPPVPTPVPMRFGGRLLPTWVRDEPRVAVAADVATSAGPVTAVTTHLSFVPWWNRRQLRLLVRALAHRRRPLLLTGDLNMDAGAAASVSGLRPLADHPTFPADRPREQLDHVLVDGSLDVRSSHAVRLPVSDHRALYVDLAVEPAVDPA